MNQRQSSRVVSLDLRLTDQVFTFVDGEGVEWHWNASLGYRLIERAPRPVMWFFPKEHGIDREHLRRRYPDLDEEHAKTADLSQPILFVPFAGGTSVLIDGWHRLLRAVTEGVEAIPCYQLSQDEADSILLARFPPGKGTL